MPQTEPGDHANSLKNIHGSCSYPPRTPTSSINRLEEPIFCLDVGDVDFSGPIYSDRAKGPYVTLSILDPVVTIERHGGKYHIAARFNMEATILGYDSRAKDGHECFFNDIRLRYNRCRWQEKENLVMKPESDPTTAFQVTRSTNTRFDASAGLSLSQIPSANVSLGLTRDTGLTVEYAVSTWTVSAHHIVNIPSPPHRDSREINLENLKRKTILWMRRRHRPNSRRSDTSTSYRRTDGSSISSVTTNESAPSDVVVIEEDDVSADMASGTGDPAYQWFWAATPEETMALTTDLKHTVKRHIVVKRVIPVAEFPTRRVEAARKHECAEELLKRWRTENVSYEKRLTAIIMASKMKKDAERARVADLTQEEEQPTLEDFLIFDFGVDIRVKQRYGRFHRLCVLSSNEVKSRFLRPTYSQHFQIQPEIDRGILIASEARIPLLDTADVNVVLDEIKSRNDGKWDELQGRRVVAIQGLEKCASTSVSRQAGSVQATLHAIGVKKIQNVLWEARTRVTTQAVTGTF